MAAHAARLSGQPRGPISGLPKVDAELGGALPPGLHIIHGQPGAGKTAFVLQLAGSCGCPALFISCEMSPLELLRRSTARVTGTYLRRLKTGELPPGDSLALAKRTIAACPQLVLADATRAFADPGWLRDAALATRGEEQNLLVVLDSVHTWADAAPGAAAEYEALNAALASLRALGHMLDCPVLAVAERNRVSMKGGGLNAGAGTRKLEYCAETVLDLARDPDASPDAAGEVPVQLVFAKNRNGAAGKKVELLFNGALQKFTEAGARWS